MRMKKVSQGSLPTTGEDVDLEFRYEPLPLSPVLLDAAGRRTYAECFAASEDGRKFRLRLRSHLEGLSDQFTTALKDDLAPHTSFSQHEEFLGAAYRHLTTSGTLSLVVTSSRRLRGKTSGQVQDKHTAHGEMLQLLLVFAFAAWLQQTERWYNMPINPERNLSVVNNLEPMTLRSLGLMVDHESKMSSTSMFAHICAICGRLLHSRCTNSHLPREVGISGPACQLRGRTTVYHALPPFVLLWSKETLGRQLRAVMLYSPETKTLKLRKGWKHAPWLHHKLHQFEVDEENPWMYCTDCHDYYVPTVKCDGGLQPKSALRLPMRNRLEALYTCWHRDLGFVHMRDALIKTFPRLAGQLPTEAEVLEFRRIRQVWVEHLRGMDPASKAAMQNPVVDELGEKLHEMEYRWSPPPHLRKDMEFTPIPSHYFRAAVGKGKQWDLRACWNKDLVPVEQDELLQDVYTFFYVNIRETNNVYACVAGRGSIILIRTTSKPPHI